MRRDDALGGGRYGKKLRASYNETVYESSEKKGMLSCCPSRQKARPARRNWGKILNGQTESHLFNEKRDGRTPARQGCQ